MGVRSGQARRRQAYVFRAPQPPGATSAQGGGVVTLSHNARNRRATRQTQLDCSASVGGRPLRCSLAVGFSWRSPPRSLRSSGLAALRCSLAVGFSWRSPPRSVIVQPQPRTGCTVRKAGTKLATTAPEDPMNLAADLGRVDGVRSLLVVAHGGALPTGVNGGSRPRVGMTLARELARASDR